MRGCSHCMEARLQCHLVDERCVFKFLPLTKTAFVWMTWMLTADKQTRPAHPASLIHWLEPREGLWEVAGDRTALKASVIADWGLCLPSVQECMCSEGRKQQQCSFSAGGCHAFNLCLIHSAVPTAVFLKARALHLGAGSARYGYKSTQEQGE